MISTRSRRLVVSLLTLFVVLGISGYAAGIFTGEVRREDACTLCRATRYSGYHYGFPYSRIEENVFTRWYRQEIDPRHGLDPRHPHQFQQSACTTVVNPGLSTVSYSCIRVPPLFLVRPELQFEVMRRIRDRETQIAVLRALDSPDRRANARRARLLIEYYYLDRKEVPWPRWWRQHAAEFGVTLANRSS